MWTSQVYGHHDKMACTKTHRTSQTWSIQRRNIHKEIIIFCVFRILLVFFIFNFQLLKGLLQKMLNYRLGTVNEKHWGFKPVFRCSKPHIFSTFFGEDKEKKCPFRGRKNDKNLYVSIKIIVPTQYLTLFCFV